MQINMESLSKFVETKFGKFALGTGAFILVMCLIGASGGSTVNAQEKNLQESVTMSQSDYDISGPKADKELFEAQDSVRQHCEDWKALANAKLDMDAFLKRDVTAAKVVVNSVSCAQGAEALVPSIVPASFL